MCVDWWVVELVHDPVYCVIVYLSWTLVHRSASRDQEVAMTSERTEGIETSAETTFRDFQNDLNTLANERERPVVLIDGNMDDFVKDYATVMARLAAGKDKRLSVLLSSPGGSGPAAYRMILYMRQYADNIEVLVPFEAKSAATLFCLGADTIYMGRESELGPLDPQILDRTGRARRVSVLETFKGLEHLLNHSLQAHDAIVDMLLERAHLDVPNAIKNAEPLFAAIVSSLYKNVNLHELSEFGRYLAQIEQYALRVMLRWGYASEYPIEVYRIVRKLVWEYPSHEFVIDLKEAQDIGLNVKPMDSSSEEISKRILDSGFSFGLGRPGESADLGNPDSKTLDKEAEEDGDEA